MTLTQCHGFSIDKQVFHDDVTKWKHFPRNWSFVRGIHRAPVNSPHKGQWRGALMFSLICARINGWVNNHEAGDLRRLRAHYDVIVMVCLPDEMRSTHQDTTKLGSFIPLVTHTTWLDFGEILLETCFLSIFPIMWYVFFKAKHSIGHTSGEVGVIDAKWKGGASVEYWENYVTIIVATSTVSVKRLSGTQFIYSYITYRNRK